MVVEVVETAYGQSNVDGEYCLFVKVKVGNATRNTRAYGSGSF